MSTSTERLSPQSLMTITVLIVSTFVVILNETIMNVALPVLMHEFSVSPDTIQWLATIFMLTMAVVIPTTGFLLQKLSTRKAFMLAMGLFTVGTILAAAAPGFSVLLIARVIQASGTAIMMPLLMTTILDLVPPERRGVLMGNVSIVISVAPAVGPTISGLILQFLSWRFMFIAVAPIAILALLIGAPRLGNEPGESRAPLSFVSLLLAVPGFGGLVYGLSRLSAAGFDASNAMILAGALICLVAFALLQSRLQRNERALLDLRPFTYRPFTLGLLLMIFAMVALFGVIILLPMYFSNILGFETLTTGLILLPGGLLMGLLAPTVGRLFDKFGPAPLVVPGAALLVLVLLGYAVVLGPETAVWLLIVMHLVMSLGMALIFTPAFTTALNPLPHELHSHGSAVLSTLQQLGGALGTALVVGVVAASTTAKQAAGIPQPQASIEGFSAGFFVAAACGLAVLVLGAMLGGKKVVVEPASEPGAVPADH